MSKITERATVSYEASLLLNEREIYALNQVLAYGGREMAKGIVERIGSRDIQKFEATLGELFEAMRSELALIVSKGQDARAVFSGLAKAVREPKPNIS